MRAGALLLSEPGLALIERNRAGQHYYVIPGGTIESGETPQQAAAREIKEETGLDVDIGSLVAVVQFRGDVQYYFAAEVRGGTYGTGTGPELRRTLEDPRGTYRPVWIPLDELTAIPIRPRKMAEIVLQGVTEGWPTSPVEIRDHGE